MDLDYNLLKVFTKVAELGSFTKASKILNQPKSRVSRAISRLERELGVELIRRTTRKVSLTSVGEEFYQNVSKVLNELNNELVRVSDNKNELEGVIRVTTSDSFAQYSLVEIISEFNSKYPKVKFDMVITNEYVDLIKQNIDVAFRAGKLEDSTMIQKKFVPTMFILVCSKKYIDKYSIPNSLEDLSNHKFLSFKPLEKLFIKAKIELDSILVTDSLPMLLRMALNGDGITVLPNIVCQKFIDSKELIRVISSWQSKSENAHILYPPTKNQPIRVKEFIKTAKNYYLDK
ncbi:LysR family transcriptional regulator [Bacteriovoracaceae bacterium]|nr:LysR family transcriptional regulator [Bacteriovoracaceae bacterium]